MLIRGDARQIPLHDASVDCVVTSPPYFGLRDYGIPAQIGLEATPDAYVAALVRVFAEVWRVLKPQGTVWVNLGDSYAANGLSGLGTTTGHGLFRGGAKTDSRIRERIVPTGLKPKDLIGIPWRVAFALQAAGWYLRSDIIWHKPNPMPESVTDRPTKAHEYLFLLTKSERYHYEAKAIAEPSTYAGKVVTLGDKSLSRGQANGAGISASGNGLADSVIVSDTRNRRSVWTVPTMPYAEAHFATMPEALVEPCILAGCPMGGVVFDPFVGSGTVISVAQRLSRHGVGLDLTYQDLAKDRTSQRGLMFA